MGEEPDRYLRLTAAARLLGVSRWTLDKHATECGPRSGPRLAVNAATVRLRP